MNLSQLANSRILEQPTYLPGKPIEEVAAEFGLEPSEICKLASNENPWGASPRAIESGKSALNNVHLYPEGSGEKLRLAISRHIKIETSQIILGNGSNEIIELIGHVFLKSGDQWKRSTRRKLST